MPDDDEKFTAEEIADYEGLSPEELTKVQRYMKWHGQKALKKAQMENPPEERKLPSAVSSTSSDGITLKMLKEMVADPETRSILRNLSDKADELLKTKPNKKGQSGEDVPPGPNVRKLFRI